MCIKYDNMNILIFMFEVFLEEVIYILIWTCSWMNKSQAAHMKLSSTAKMTIKKDFYI